MNLNHISPKNTKKNRKLSAVTIICRLQLSICLCHTFLSSFSLLLPKRKGYEYRNEYIIEDKQSKFELDLLL